MRRSVVRSSGREGPPSAIQRVITIAAVLALAFGVGIMWYEFLGRSGKPFVFIDLDYYRAALQTVVAQQPLYPSLPYPPVAVLLIAGLGGLPVVLGNQVWTAASIITCLTLGALVTWRSSQALGEERVDRWEFVLRGSIAALLLLTSLPMFSQLENGQITLLIIALAFLDVAQVVSKKAQGILVGVAGAIKLTPLIFIPYYLVTGQRRQAAVATASFGLVTALGFAMFPSDSLFFWAHLGKNDQFGDPARFDNLSIHAALERWLPAVNQLPLAWVALGLVVAVFAMVRARRHFLHGEMMAAALTVGASSVVLAPITWPHYDVWVVLAALWLLLSSERRSKLIGLAIYLVFSLPYALMIMSAASDRSLLALVASDVRVLVPVLIAVFGLPRRPATTAEPSTAALVGQSDSASTAA